jgi:hypothetical protein
MGKELMQEHPHLIKRASAWRKTAGQASKLLFEIYLDICCAKH